MPMSRPTPRQREALSIVAAGRFYPALVREADGWYARWRPVVTIAKASEALAGWVDELVRSAAITPLTAEAENRHYETLHDAWMAALKSRTGLVAWDSAECATFAAELSAWSGSEVGAVEARSSIKFVFSSAQVPLSGIPELTVSSPVPRGYLQLKALGQAVYVWDRLRELKLVEDANGKRLVVKLNRAQAEDFLLRGAKALKDAGYEVEGVKDFTVKVTAAAEVDGERNRTELKLVIKVDGEIVSAEEIRFLLDQHSALVFFRNRWIEVDRNILKEALRALEKTQGLKKLSPLGLVMGVGAIGRLEIETVAAHGWLRGVMNELASRGEAAAKFVLSADFCGKLRGYQRLAAGWLRFLTERGFGALLADDMGLGKTIETIAWMLGEPRDNFGRLKKPVLIVAPLTLIANWRHELGVFAPTLRVYVHHGENRHLASGFKAAVRDTEVVLTSYTILVKEEPLFAEVDWDALVIDEAQSIKNPDTRLAKAVRALSPAKRIALTGTPIENSPLDVWSIEDFLNPGFLGERKIFEARFVKPLMADPSSTAGAKLAYALEPFVLRRLKSDPEIAAELGGKQLVNEYCELDAASRANYEQALADYRHSQRRQGDVFALITKLKLICDSRAKFDRLRELLASIFAAGESALIFTQYVKVAAAIREELERAFGRRFAYLNGALDAKAREAEIARFNRDKGATAFILSLRTGGFGLNLTKATHVIHFDRWWNPAVENQATDRAHRIGQGRTVMVHNFITLGTLEERIDELLARKRSLAGLLKDGAELERMVGLE